MKQSIVPFIQTHRQKQLFMTQTLIMCFNQSIVQSEGSCWTITIDSVIEQNIEISKYKSWNGTSYIKTSKELKNSKIGFINNQNTDNKECLKRWLVRYLHLIDKNISRIGKTDKEKENLILKRQNFLSKLKILFLKNVYQH